MSDEFNVIGVGDDEEGLKTLEGLLAALQDALDPNRILDEAFSSDPEDTLELRLTQVDLLALHLAISTSEVKQNARVGTLMRKIDTAVIEQKTNEDPRPVGFFPGEEGYDGKNVAAEAAFSQTIPPFDQDNL